MFLRGRHPVATPIKGKEKAARTHAESEYGSARRVSGPERRRPLTLEKKNAEEL
jgi:hypothetical protein